MENTSENQNVSQEVTSTTPEVTTPEVTTTGAPARKSLREILNLSSRSIKQESTTLPTKENDLEETIRIVMRLMAQVSAVKSAVVKEKLSKLSEPTLENKELGETLQVLMALSRKENGAPNLEPWEKTAQTTALYDIREKIAETVMSRNRRGIEQNNKKTNDDMLQALVGFRKISKPKELSYCAKEGMTPGPNLTKGSRNNPAVNAIEEIVYLLTQISLGENKNQSIALTAEEASEIHNISLKLQNKKTPRPDLSFILNSRSEFISSGGAGKKESLEIIKSFIEGLNPNEKSKALLEREISLFDTRSESLGTELEELDTIQKEEFQTVQTLEDIFNKLDNVEPAKAFTAPKTAEETKLLIFQGIRELSPALGKISTLVLTEELSQDEDWLPSFLENGTDAIYQSKKFKNMLVLTEPENTVFGKATDPNSYMEEGKTLRDALNHIYTAESGIYSRAVFNSLTQEDREDIITASKKLIETDITEEDFTNSPLLKKLEEIRNNAEVMAKAIAKEIEGAETSLEMLPAALREKEKQDRVATSLARLINTVNQPEVEKAIDELLTDLDEEIKNLSAKNLSEEEKAVLIHKKERKVTLEALKAIGETQSTEEPENNVYEGLLNTVSMTVVPKSPHEHALISLCDNKSDTGVKLKTKEVLDILENKTGIKNLTGMVRRDLGNLRQWKERESIPQTISRKDLAVSICHTPDNLKNSIKTDLINALKGCLIANPWKSPYNISSKELGYCNRAYLLAKENYGANDKTFKAIKLLHLRTGELQKEANNSIWVRAQLVANDLRSNERTSLKQLEYDLLEATLKSDNPKAAVEYLASWYNSIGNEHTLQKENVVSGKENPYKFEPIPLVAAKIQTKIENLLEIGGYLKSVSENPEALAEAHFQSRLSKMRPNKEEAWETRLNKLEEKTVKEIEENQNLLNEWKDKFNAIFDDIDDEEYTKEEIERRESMKTVCQRKISQEERKIEKHGLKLERIAAMKSTSLSIKGVTKPEEVAKAICENEKNSSFDNSLAEALNRAMALASSPTKLNLPKNAPKKVTPLDMLEAGAVQRTIDEVRNSLEKAQNILKFSSPNAVNIDVHSDSPHNIARELKKTIFETIKEIEVHLWESGKSIELTSEEQEELLRENPELLSNRKEWIDNLRKTETNVSKVAEIATTLPQKKVKSKPKQEKEEFDQEEVTM